MSEPLPTRPRYRRVAGSVSEGGGWSAWTMRSPHWQCPTEHLGYRVVSVRRTETVGNSPGRQAQQTQTA